MQVRAKVGEIDPKHHPDCTNLSWAVRGRLSDWVRTSVKTLSINCDPCSFSETLPLAKGMPVGVPTIRQHAHDTLCAGRGMRRSVRNNKLVNRPSSWRVSQKWVISLVGKQSNICYFSTIFFSVQKWHERKLATSHLLLIWKCFNEGKKIRL